MFESPFNKGVTREILREVQTDVPCIKEEEIIRKPILNFMQLLQIESNFLSLYYNIGGCQVYFKSSNDDKKHRTSGTYNQHKQKKNGHLKHVRL